MPASGDTVSPSCAKATASASNLAAAVRPGPSTRHHHWNWAADAGEGRSKATSRRTPFPATAISGCIEAPLTAPRGAVAR